MSVPTHLDLEFLLKHLQRAFNLAPEATPRVSIGTFKKLLAKSSSRVLRLTFVPYAGGALRLVAAIFLSPNMRGLVQATSLRLGRTAWDDVLFQENARLRIKFYLASFRAATTGHV